MKTTVYLDATVYRRLQAIAASEGRSAAELIRVAVAEYTGRHEGPQMPTSLGMGDSGDPTFAARAEEFLERFGSS